MCVPCKYQDEKIMPINAQSAVAVFCSVLDIGKETLQFSITEGKGSNVAEKEAADRN